MLPKLLLLAALTGFGTLSDDDWPPKRFQKTGVVAVVFAADQAEIDMLCGKAPKDLRTEACADEKFIVLPDPCQFPRTESFAKLACHENAHFFGGWPETHPK